MAELKKRERSLSLEREAEDFWTFYMDINPLYIEFSNPSCATFHATRAEALQWLRAALAEVEAAE